MTQNQKLLAYLKSGNSISPLEALNIFGIMRLASRIHDLSKQGHTIQSKMVKKGDKTFAVYSLVE